MSPDSRAVAPPSPGAAAPELPPGRRRLAHGVIWTLILGHALAIAFQAELFPFSYYPMFSRSMAGKRDYTQMSLVGVAGGAEVVLDRQLVRAASSTRIKHLRNLFDRVQQRDASRVPQLMAQFLRAYDELRASERPGLPELSGLRLYRETFRLDPQARNRRAPERRELLRDFQRPSAGPSPETLR